MNRKEGGVTRTREDPRLGSARLCQMVRAQRPKAIKPLDLGFENLYHSGLLA